MYEASYRVRFSETGKDGKMSMNGVLRLFQDCGYEHALDRGFGPILRRGHAVRGI